MTGRTVTFDIETYSADLLYSMPAEKFVRLIGYSFDNEDEVHLTTDLEEIREVLRSARMIVGHNIHAFDLKAVFGPASNEPLEMTMQKRVFDTWAHASIVNPAPSEFINRYGAPVKIRKPGDAEERWFGLDEQAFQLGVVGKTHDLKELALEFGDPELKKKKQRISDGFGKIPIDDDRYREYLKGDVRASRHLGKALLKLGPLDAYAMRNQEINARVAIIGSNGVRVWKENAQARVDALAKRRAEIMDMLVEKYDFPTEGDAPWDSNDGKRAILSALEDRGITPISRPNWPKTPVWEKKADKIAEAEEKAAKLEEKIEGWGSELILGDLPERSVQACRGVPGEHHHQCPWSADPRLARQPDG